MAPKLPSRNTTWYGLLGLLILVGLGVHNVWIGWHGETLRDTRWHFVPTAPLSKMSFQEMISSTNKMFFLETSGRNVFNPRQACAIESAFRRTQLDINVMVRSTNLSLDDNTTRQLVNLGHEGQISNRTIRFIEINHISQELQGFPFDTDDFKQTIRGHRFEPTYLSDALRLIYLYRYGGWYGDLDFIFLRSLAQLNGSFVATTSSKSGKSLYLTNAAMKFDRGHPFVWAYMEAMIGAFRGRARAEMGPNVLTNALKLFCNATKANLKTYINRTICGNITILPPESLLPFKMFELGDLWSNKPKAPAFWDRRLRSSLGIHFFSYLTTDRQVRRRPKFEAYSHLGPQFCPNAFYSAPNF